MAVRKNYLNLTLHERARFNDALFHLGRNKTIDYYTGLHGYWTLQRTLPDGRQLPGIHHSTHFLPWHRELLLRVEREMQAFDPSVTIPYWDFSTNQSSNDVIWQPPFLGQFDALWGLGRVLGNYRLPVTTDVDKRQATNMFYDPSGPNGSDVGYSHTLEHIVHDPPHVWVGGVMRTEWSPRDPAFYLHHAWIDMLWSQWQLAHLGAAGAWGETPAQGRFHFGLDDEMLGWTGRTPHDVITHTALGYNYDVEFLPGRWGMGAKGNEMKPDEYLSPGHALSSQNGRFFLIYLGDGTLVLYDRHNGPTWHSPTSRPVGVCIMQSDGNLVIYGPGPAYVWDSGSWGNHDSRLVVQDDGNVVIYRPDNTAAWQTGTAVGP